MYVKTGIVNCRGGQLQTARLGIGNRALPTSLARLQALHHINIYAAPHALDYMPMIQQLANIPRQTAT